MPLYMLWESGIWREIAFAAIHSIMQRIVVQMIGVMISSTVLTLVVIPAIYGLVKGRGLPRREVPNAQTVPTWVPPVELHVDGVQELAK